MKCAGGPLSDTLLKESYPLEKGEVQSKKNSPSFTCVCPYPILGHIFTFFSTEKDLFAADMVFKEAGFYTDLAWERLARQERLDINWSLPDCHSKRPSKKTHYLHGKVLVVYSIAREKLWIKVPAGPLIPPTYQRVKTLFGRFQTVMERYPSSLGAFLWKDLNSLHKLDSATHDQLFHRDFSIGANAGNLLLKGLSYLTEYSLLNQSSEEDVKQEQLLRSASLSLEEAIEKGATVATYLAIQILYPKYLGHNWERCYNWYHSLMVSSTDKGDYRGLDKLLDKFPKISKVFYDRGTLLPPILVKLALTLEKTPEEKEDLLNEAIKGYKDFVPPDVYAAAALAKLDLQKLEEAENYFTKAIIGYGSNVPPGVYRDLAVGKLKLGKLEEARDYYSKAIIAYGSNVPADVYANAAEVKLRLCRLEGREDELTTLEEIEHYFIKSMIGYDESEVPFWIYVQAASVQLMMYENENTDLMEKQELLERAEGNFDHAITAGGIDLPAEVYEDAGLLKLQLGKFHKAEDYYKQAIIHYRINVPAKLYMNLAQVEERLYEYKEVETYCMKAITAYGRDVPADVYLSTALVKFKVGKYSEAEDYCTSALIACESDVSADVYECVARIKSRLVLSHS